MTLKTKLDVSSYLRSRVAVISPVTWLMAKLVVVGEVLILYRMVSESKSFPVTVNIEPYFRVEIALAVPVAEI